MQRDLKLDGVKFVLMILVVFGHLEFVDYHLGVFRIIYAFHMPTFVFLSGYFTSDNSDFRRRYFWCLKTFALYLGLQWADYAFFKCTGVEVGPKHLLGIWPLFAAWYLLALIFWRCFVWLLSRRVDGRLMLVGSVIAGIGIGYLPLSRELAVQQMFTYLAFFILGYLGRKCRLMELIYRIDVRMAFAVFGFGVCVARLMPDFIPVVPYSGTRDAICRCGGMALGMLLTFSFIAIVRHLPIEKLSKYGRYTLWIYLGHVIPVLGCNYFLRKYNMHISVLHASFLAIAFPLGLACLCDKLKGEGR